MYLTHPRNGKEARVSPVVWACDSVVTEFEGTAKVRAMLVIWKEVSPTIKWTQWKFYELYLKKEKYTAIQIPLNVLIFRFK